MTRTRLAGAGRVARGAKPMAGLMAGIAELGCMCIPICTCTGCLEGCRPDTALRPGRAERS